MPSGAPTLPPDLPYPLSHVVSNPASCHPVPYTLWYPC